MSIKLICSGIFLFSLVWFANYKVKEKKQSACCYQEMADLLHQIYGMIESMNLPLPDCFIKASKLVKKEPALTVCFEEIGNALLKGEQEYIANELKPLDEALIASEDFEMFRSFILNLGGLDKENQLVKLRMVEERFLKEAEERSKKQKEYDKFIYSMCVCGALLVVIILI